MGIGVHPPASMEYSPCHGCSSSAMLAFGGRVRRSDNRIASWASLAGRTANRLPLSPLTGRKGGDVRLLEESWTAEDGGLVWSRFHERFSALFSNVAEVVLASERTIHFALLGLFAGGHILLEDLPGVGKTLLGKTIAQSIAGQFSRIQFTPDLLPTDITGSSIFDMRNNRFEFVPSPIFANSVLADEVNRMGPRTQSALLEAMGESQVTVDGAVRELPWPFMVVATQNWPRATGFSPCPTRS